jgi:type II secretory pathway component PulM
MRRFSRREQILIGACVIAVLCVGLPLLWEQIRSGLPSSETSASRLRAARQERVTQAAALARLEGEMQRVARRQPAAALPAQVMAALDRSARAEGIELREVRPELPKPLDGAVGVPLQLSFSAPFPQAARFLTRLRLSPNGLAVERMVIAASSGNSDQVTVQARVLAFSSATDNREGRRG